MDGDSNTYWSSEFKDGAWLAVDLGAVKKISRVLHPMGSRFREGVFASGFDGRQVSGPMCTRPMPARGCERDQVRSYRGAARATAGTQRGTQWGNAVYELEVFEK